MYVYIYTEYIGSVNILVELWTHSLRPQSVSHTYLLIFIPVFLSYLKNFFITYEPCIKMNNACKNTTIDSETIPFTIFSGKIDFCGVLGGKGEGRTRITKRTFKKNFCFCI